jgi:hypothetical protein
MRAIWRAWIGLVPLFAVLMGMIGTASAQQPKSATDGDGSLHGEARSNARRQGGGSKLLSC